MLGSGVGCRPQNGSPPRPHQPPGPQAHPRRTSAAPEKQGRGDRDNVWHTGTTLFKIPWREKPLMLREPLFIQRKKTNLRKLRKNYGN